MEEQNHFCRNCGGAVNPEDKFCGKCGLTNLREKQLDSINFNMNETIPEKSNPSNFLMNLFKGRVGRLDYFFSWILFVFLPIIFLDFFQSVASQPFLYAFSILMFFMSLLHMSVVVRRFHDIVLSGFSIFLMFIPFLNVVIILGLLFKKGTEGVNKYGQINENGFFKRILNLS